LALPELDAQEFARAYWWHIRGRTGGSSVWDHYRGGFSCAMVAEEVLGVRVQPVDEIAPEDLSVDPPLGEIAGAMDRQTSTILVSRKFSPRSQRFTIAHEVYHWLVHTDIVSLRERAPEGSLVHGMLPERERVCNRFAGDVLAPRDLVERFVIDERGLRPIRLSNLEENHAAYWLGMALGRPGAEATRLAMLGIDKIALAVARITHTPRGHNLPSPMDAFGVSAMAMAVQLKRIGLVSQ